MIMELLKAGDFQNSRGSIEKASPCHFKGCFPSTQLGGSELITSVNASQSRAFRECHTAVEDKVFCCHQCSSSRSSAVRHGPCIRNCRANILTLPLHQLSPQPGFSTLQSTQSSWKLCPRERRQSTGLPWQQGQHTKFFLSYLCWAHYLRKCVRGACFWTLAEGGKWSMKCCLVGIEEEQKSSKIYRGQFIIQP